MVLLMLKAEPHRKTSVGQSWALLGTNTAVMLFQGIEQEANPSPIREVALTIITQRFLPSHLLPHLYVHVGKQRKT